jgi:AraC family transcriptional regulator of arabinose operon
MSEGTVPLDETMIDHEPRAQGFAGERISVLPRPLVREALTRPLTSRLLVTDCGYFPTAAEHRRSRPSGSEQTIVIVCADGAGWCRLPSGTFDVPAGHALVIPAGVAHAYGASADRPWTIWWLHLAGADLGELLDAAQVRPGGSVIRVGDVYRAVSLIDDALHRMEHDDSARSRQAAAGTAWHLLALLAADRAATPSTRNDAFEQAQRYLRERIGSRVSVAELAALTRLSPSHFAALFRRTTGVGVLQYQTRLRMARARELLDTTDMAIAEIARTLGYQDPFYFSRHFRSVHGVTASEYRAQHKG